MNAFKKISQIALAVSVVFAGTALAEEFSFADAMKNGKAKVSFRARYEQVDENGPNESADALTNRTRVTFTSANFGHWKFNVEMDNVTALIEDYNSTTNGKAQYSKVVDPEGTDLNLANFGYKNENTTAVIGRQRINFDNQRFVGGVGWRQNEQTYDGLLINQQVSDNFEMTYAFVDNINRIFGPSGASSDVYGEHHLFNGSYKLDGDHKLGFTALYLNPKTVNAQKFGSTTVGLDYQGKSGMASWQLAYASQSDDGRAATDYSADYLLAELTLKFEPVAVTVGHEVLGSDNGTAAFATPLATLHKFQGFADIFLATPTNGVQDTYLKLATKAGQTKFALIYHDFAADFGSNDHGSEIDLVADHVISDNYSLLFKYASYRADNTATDTDKVWFMFTAKY